MKTLSKKLADIKYTEDDVRILSEQYSYASNKLDNMIEELIAEGYYYKDLFIGSMEKTDETYHGKILGIKDLVTYESSSLSGLQSAFEDAVEEYIEFLEFNGRYDDSYNGSIIED